MLRYAAASILLPIAFYSFWIPVKTDVLQSGVISLNDFNPFYKKQKGSYQVDHNALPELVLEIDQPIRLQIAHVITSYSIHYTKLYDSVFENAQLGQVIGPYQANGAYNVAKVIGFTRDTINARHILLQVPEGKDAAVKATVITSYSIHYTKLYD